MSRPHFASSCLHEPPGLADRVKMSSGGAKEVRNIYYQYKLIVSEQNVNTARSKATSKKNKKYNSRGALL